MNRQLNEREKLIMTCVGQGNGKYEHMEEAIGKSRAIVQMIVNHLIEEGLLLRLKGPKGGGLANGLRLTEKGQRLYDNWNRRN